MKKRILVVLSEWGFWGEELIGPLDVLSGAGYELDFMTPFGRKPPALPPSMDEEYIEERIRGSTEYIEEKRAKKTKTKKEDRGRGTTPSER